MKTEITVRKFMLKKFPPSEYMDCPVPKHHWDIIQEFAELYASQSKWISVEERLPELTEDVLIYADIELVTSGNVCKGYVIGNIYSNGFATTKSYVIIKKAISWQPLPTPPEK